MMTITPQSPSIEVSTTSVNYNLLLPGIRYTAVLIAIFSNGQTARSRPASFTPEADST